MFKHVHAGRRFPNERAVDDHERNIGLGRHIDDGIQGLRLIGGQNEDVRLLREQGLAVLKLFGGIAGAIRPYIVDARANRFELLAPLLHRVDEGGAPGIVHVAVREGDEIVLLGNRQIRRRRQKPMASGSQAMRRRRREPPRREESGGDLGEQSDSSWSWSSSHCATP